MAAILRADGMAEWWNSLVVFSVILKSLLIPAYHSSDFEVHRNWLAITNSLPLSRWYYESTSQWTLDYPPLFAWFEYLLSQVAVLIDPKMVVISKLEYVSISTVLFQRGSVIVTDLVLAYAVKEYCRYLAKRSSLPARNCLILAMLVIFNFGLLIVDHIHFQYNGFLFGIFLLSIAKLSEGMILEGSFWFAVLLNFKHIFLYIAPAYFVFLLRSYCFQPSAAEKKEKQLRICGVNIWDFSPLNLVKLGFIVVIVFGASFGPFIAMGQLSQVLSRLFPFKRGLCHAYWAPNVWALYNALDKAVAILGSKSGFFPKELFNKQASMTGGLVGQSEHLILPAVPPIVTVILTLLSVLPALLHVWFRPSGVTGFLRCLILCAFGSFLFGWHVHEKAILMVIIPLSLMAIVDQRAARVFLVLSTTGHLSLFPLLFQSQETPIKVCLMLMFTIFSFYSLCLVHCGESSEKSVVGDLFKLPIVEWYEAWYLYGLVFLEFYCGAIHPFTALAVKLPFLPLMLTSVYCTVGVVWAWILFYVDTLKTSPIANSPVVGTTRRKTAGKKPAKRK
ncbi:probable dolichyl pyrophosphate Glc1Man9GlcNAc2 alpha-1,3-glucosyltransferase isoform X1 [Orbicella faveolata]|uniref:probable dolichyl pyrophosphate Glc1Man9GlcNAc2 alpha-1,3-glucosyltransferase isoform X1 n=2 Tax=Orbicella faveolata TaxID=48498 RepID=UPI0009E2AC4B|nr:probable dolichyl pyrophosphate Glc1Man9GlcNAc2 alpha-1,3-glucosyltransferase isoform X1 [Orbicella faveolata]